MFSKKMRFFLIFSFLLVFAFSIIQGCSQNLSDEGKSILAIEKTASIDGVDYYAVIYSDGTDYVFEVKNGKDGSNGESPTIEEIYNSYLKENPTVTFDEFLEKFLSVSDQTSFATAKALSSSVKIYAEFVEAYYGFPHQSAYQKNVYSGGGVVYEINGDYTYIVTNYHVVYSGSSALSSKISDKITCYLYGSESTPSLTSNRDGYGTSVYDYGDMAIPLEYVGGSISADLALLRCETSKISQINGSVKAVELAEEYQVGQTAIAVGNPEDGGISVTKGIVSVDNEFIALSIDGVSREYRSIRIDTPLYSGNSGGGLFDGVGNLIGINNAGDGEDQNVNFAIPVDIVSAVVDNLIHYGEKGFSNPYKIVLGISVTTENSKCIYDEEKGVAKIVEDTVLVEVEKDGIAEKLGLKKGDVITFLKINEKVFEISRYFQISDLLFSVFEDDEIIVLYEREDSPCESFSYKVTKSDLKPTD